MLSSDECRVSTGFLPICKGQLRAAKRFIAECRHIPTTSLFPNLEAWHAPPAISVNWRRRCLCRRKRSMLVSVCGKNRRGLRSLPLSSKWYLLVLSLESSRILLVFGDVSFCLFKFRTAEKLFSAGTHSSTGTLSLQRRI
jgi:hypothetical protein